MSAKKDKFLFIHYHYPPVRNSGIYRNYFLSGAISDLTGEAHLITSDLQKVLPREEMPDHRNVKRHEIFSLDYRRLTSWFSKNKQNGGARFSENYKKSRLIQWIIKVQRSFPFNILMAEGGIFYMLLGYHKAKKIIEKEKITVVFSSFMPYADHIIAFLLKKKYPDLYWVADFRDLHIEPIYKNIIWEQFQRKIEGWILGRADLITCVSKGITEKMKYVNRPILTLTKGVHPRPEIPHYRIFTIAYTGSLFLSYRDPKPLFRAIKSLIDEGDIPSEQIRFAYAGKDSGLMNVWAKTCSLGNQFVDMGLLSRDKSLEVQSASHVNVLLTTASTNHQGLLTGKVFEYFEAGNPVLCLIQGEKDQEIEALFSELKAGTVIYDDENAIKNLKEFILLKFNEWKSEGAVKSSLNTKMLHDNYSWQKQAEKLLNAIDESGKI